jgi:heme exporter protein A
MTVTQAQPDAASSAGQAANPSAVEATGLCLSLDDREVLCDVHLDVPAGAAVALLGANGAGKSTLLRVLGTLTPPTAGRLRLFGQDVSGHSVAIRSRIGLISHQPMLYRDLTVGENLEFFGKLYGVPAPRRRAAELLDLVGLVDRRDQAVKTLSRGMVQRAAIARALMHQPDLLLADEPFDGLDAPSAAGLADLLVQLRQAGRTIIVANHDIRQSLELSDRAVVLRRGRVVLDQAVRGLDEQAVMKELVGP